MKKYMQLAIQSAEKGMRLLEGGPFGACLIKGKRILAVSHNTVLKQKDPTCHAEMNTIRIAAKKLKTFQLKDCIIYSTTEPCPMCFSAIHWAGIKKIIFGTTIQHVQKRGFNELSISNQMLRQLGISKVQIKSGFMKKECLDLLHGWDRQKVKVIY